MSVVICTTNTFTYLRLILCTSYLIETVILLNILYICICLLNITVGTQDLTVCVVVIDFYLKCQLIDPLFNWLYGWPWSSCGGR